MTQREGIETGLRTVLMALVVNAVLAVIKVMTGLVGHSYALIADGIESITDLAVSAVVYGGLRLSVAPPDENHPYGHGRAESLATLFVSFALGAAAVVILVQSAREIIAPHHAPAPYTLAVLAAVILIKESLFRRMNAAGESARSMAVSADAWHQRSDALTSGAAFIGIAIALWGGSGYEAADDWAAVFAAGIILANAWRLAHPAVSEIMDAAPGEELFRRIRDTAGGVEGVIEIEKCLVRKAGKNHFVDLHVVVDGARTVRDGHRIAHEVKDAILAGLSEIGDVLVHIEPAKEVVPDRRAP